MVRQLLHALPAEERRDFESACARHGFVWEDFEVNVDEAHGQRDGSASGSRTITVVRVIGGDVRQYPAVAGNAWTTAFEQDLARDAFGFPLAD